MTDRPITIKDLKDYKEWCDNHKYISRSGKDTPVKPTIKGFIEWLESWEPVRNKGNR